MPDPYAADLRSLEPLFGNGFEFLKLHVPAATRTMRSGKIVKLGKSPVEKRWTTIKPGGDQDAREWLLGGHNVGVRLRASDLVLDVDPRHGGDESLDRLEIALGLKFRDAYPYVETGSGGLHVYLSKPADLRSATKLDGYAGLEFKTKGTQVVAPGSIHPDTLLPYRVTDPLACFDDLPKAPDRLLGMLKVQDVTVPAEAGRHAPEELEAMLSKLDPRDYADEGDWRDLMMACHHATAGAGREEFVSWSIGDPDYAHDEELIRARWNSLKAGKAGSITERTLYKALSRAGHADAIPRTSAAEDFAGLKGEILAPPPNGEGALTVNKAERAVDDMKNALAAIAASPVRPAYDELKQAVVFLGDLPWGDGYGRMLDDHTLRLLRLHLIREHAAFDYQPSKENVFEAVTTLAYQDRFNPVCNYLDRLQWDRKPRVEQLFARYFKVTDDAYSRAVSRCFMVAAVRRQRQPGCKFDTMPVLRGKQGTMKSTGIKAQFGADWFSDADLGNLGSKDAPLLLHNVWVQEFAELDGLRRADANTLKAFCSRSVDRVRPPYGKGVVDMPRRCIFIGTVNEGGYLIDSTGNRRFWPLEVQAEVDVEAIRRDRDQLWAEASQLEAQEASIVLDRDLWSAAAEKQAEETTEDPWADKIRAHIDHVRRTAADPDWDDGGCPRDPNRLQSTHILESILGIAPGQHTKGSSQRLKTVMAETLGWTYRKSVRVGETVGAGYVRWPMTRGRNPKTDGELTDPPSPRAERGPWAELSCLSAREGRPYVGRRRA